MNVDLSWKLTWQGETWTAADLTGNEWADLVLLLGERWEALSPMSSPVALLAHIAVHVATATGVDFEQVRAQVAASKSADLLAAIVPPGT